MVKSEAKNGCEMETEDRRPETEAEGDNPKSRERIAIREPKTEEHQ